MSDQDDTKTTEDKIPENQQDSIENEQESIEEAGTQYDDSVDTAVQAVKAPETLSKRGLIGAAAAFFVGAGVFLLMAVQMSSKIGQVDDMLNALTKRAVNMNTAISSFDELNDTIQEMGVIQAQFSDQQNLLSMTVTELKTQIPAVAAQRVATENAVVSAKINELGAVLNKQSHNITKVRESISGLSSRVKKFEEQLTDVKRLTADVDALITLERENYLAVLKRQSLLQEAQSGKQVVKVPRNPDLIFYSVKTP